MTYDPAEKSLLSELQHTITYRNTDRRRIYITRKTGIYSDENMWSGASNHLMGTLESKYRAIYIKLGLIRIGEI